MAYRTVKEIKEFGVQMLHQDETQAVLAGDTSTGRHNLLERWITKAYDKVVTYREWPWLANTVDLTWPAVASGEDASILYLPEDFDYLLSVTPQSSSHLESIDIVRAWDYDNHRQINNRSRWKETLVEFGFYNVEADNPGASTVTATSSLGATDDGLQVNVEGRVGGRPRRETLTLSSGTATSTNTYDSGAGGVQRVYIVDGSVPTGGGGIVTVTGSGSTTLEVLDAANERMHEHRRTELYSNATSSGTYSVRYYRRPLNLTADSALLDMPDRFFDALEMGIMAELATFREDWESVKYHKLEMQQRMKELSAFSNRAPGRRINIRASRQWGSGSYSY